MRGDSAYGEQKGLRIFARRRNGEQREFAFREDDFIELNLFREGGGDYGPPMVGLRSGGVDDGRMSVCVSIAIPISVATTSAWSGARALNLCHPALTTASPP
jgi:hypothetical protein